MWYFSSKLNSQSRNRNIGNHFPFSTNWGNLIYDPIGFLWLAPLCNGFYSFISNTEQPLDGSYFLPRSMSEFFNAGNIVFSFSIELFETLWFIHVIVSSANLRVRLLPLSSIGLLCSIQCLCCGGVTVTQFPKIRLNDTIADSYSCSIILTHTYDKSINKIS